MRIPGLILLSIAAINMPLAAQQAGSDRILVKYKSSDEATASKSLQKVRNRGRDFNSVKEYSRIREIGVRSVVVPNGKRDEVIKVLQSDPDVDYVEPDYVANINLEPNDPYYVSYQWHLPKISAPAAWDVTTGQTNVRIAVIDSGVDPSTPDLSGRLLGNGYDFVNFDNDPRDDNGHGTAVAGTAAASGNNGQGVAGVAWGVSILPIKVMGADGNGSYSAIASGINYAATNGARIINLSLGGTSSSRTLQDAVKFAWSKGAVVIAAAGNNGTTNPVYPAAYTECVAVSAINSSDTITSWSSRGSYVDICAPGENIATTGTNGAYVAMSGTSFSSPIVTGVASLAASRNPALNNTNIVALLKSTADDLGTPGADTLYGSGRVNASKMVASALPAPTATPSPTPTPSPSTASDTIAPVTTITNPVDGAVITRANSVRITVSSSDNVKVTKLEFYINGSLAAVSSTGSMDLTWSTFRLARGTYRLQSKAYDAAGNSAVSPLISVVK